MDNITVLLLNKLFFNEVDCHQLKQTGARSAGRSAACNDFFPTACMRNMKMWGGPSTGNWTSVERGGHRSLGKDLRGVW
jgi:hypothetical protein